MNTAKFEDNLAKGLREVCKALDSDETPDLCILAEDTSEEKYKTLITALCKQKGVPLLKMPERLQLGTMLGMCRFDHANQPRKVIGCSSVVITKFNENDSADVDIIRQKLA